MSNLCVGLNASKFMIISPTHSGGLLWWDHQEEAALKPCARKGSAPLGPSRKKKFGIVLPEGKLINFAQVNGQSCALSSPRLTLAAGLREGQFLLGHVAGMASATKASTRTGAGRGTLTFRLWGVGTISFSSVLLKSLKSMVGAQGLEPWTR